MDYQKQIQPLLTIRGAQISDAHEISKLIIKSINFFHVKNYTNKEIEIWRRGYSPTKVENQILKRQSIVLEIKREICGFIQFDAPEIKGFYINPKFSGQGFGRILLQYMLSELKANGQERVELTSNKWVVDFYKKFGFELVDEEIVYWENHPFVEYRMIKDLVIHSLNT